MPWSRGEECQEHLEKGRKKNREGRIKGLEKGSSRLGTDVLKEGAIGKNKKGRRKNHL
jgi:hypothetical protein